MVGQPQAAVQAGVDSLRSRQQWRPRPSECPVSLTSGESSQSAASALPGTTLRGQVGLTLYHVGFCLGVGCGGLTAVRGQDCSCWAA